jgi:hypothetical protein
MTYELEAGWGIRSWEFFIELFPSDRAKQVVAEIGGSEQWFKIDSVHSEEYRRLKRQFWERADLAPERLLHSAPKATGEIDNHQSRAKYAELDAEALSFFLCQKDLFWYEALVDRIFKHSDHLPTWQAWIPKHIHLLKKPDSETYITFASLFGIDGNLFSASGQLTRSAKDNLPDILQETILKADRDFRRRRNEERKREKTTQTVARIPTPQPSQTAMAALTTVSAVVSKEKVDQPSKAQIFGDVDMLRKNKKQLEQLDLTSLDKLPDGTKVELRYTVPGQKREEIVTCQLWKVQTLPLVQWKNIRWKFVYSVVITLPSTHIFEASGGSSVEIKDGWYAEAEWTEEEQQEEQLRSHRIQELTKAAPVPVSPAVQNVAQKVEHIIDPVSVSLTAVAMILEEKEAKYITQEYTGGPLMISISDEDKIDVLGQKDATKIFPEHTRWTIAEDNSITPAVFDADVNRALISIATNMRVEAQKRLEEIIIQRQEAEKQEKIQNIDAEFNRIWFLVSPALDNSDLKSELLARISSAQRKALDMKWDWEKEVSRISQFGSKDYRFYHSNHLGGFPASITLGQKVEGGWSATLILQPDLSFRALNIPKEDAALFMSRLENALMTFAYDMLKNGNNTVEAMVHETLAREDVPKLKKKYKRELKAKKGRILVQDSNGHFHVIGGVSKDDFLQTIQTAKDQYGSQNVALLMRLDTLHFHGVDDIIKPRPERVKDTYEDFYDREVGEERRKILSARVLSTLFNGAAGAGRDSFIVGSAVDVVLSELRKKKENELKRDIIQSDITDSFIKEFIEMLKGSKSVAAIPVIYISHRVAYCTEEDHRDFTAD